MVAEVIAYHPLISQYLRFIATTAGRDKVLRTIQYWSRFYSWYLLRTNKPQSTIAPWNTIKSQFSLTRKILRFGKNIEHIKAVAVALNSQPKADGDALLKYLTVGRQMGYATYLTFDMISYLHGSGIRKIKNFKEMADYAARAWFAGLLCSVLAGLYSIFRLAKREQAIDRKEGEGVVEAKKVQKERSSVVTQLISDLGDIINPATSLGYTNFDDGIIGLGGLVSSFIGLRAAWNKVA